MQLVLILLSLVLAYAVARYGAVLRLDLAVCFLGVGLVSLYYWSRPKRKGYAPPLSPWLKWPPLLLIGYVALQLAPMPQALLALLSPARAALLEPVKPLGAAPWLAPLSVIPAATLEQLMRLASCTLIFLLVRELAWHFPRRPWLLAAPLIVIAALEALLGLAQAFEVVGDFPPISQAAALARGSYANRNHFAGLLELALPFALVYAITLLKRYRTHWDLILQPVVAACGMLSVAALILLGILFSLSRMGFLAMLASLFFLAVLMLSAGLAKWKKRLAVSWAAMLVLGLFIYLPPGQLIQRFGKASTVEAITDEGRLLLWHDTLGLIRAYPLFGCGLGGFESAFPRYLQSEKLLQADVTDDYAHNDYLQYLAELGGIGFALGALFVAAILSKSWRSLDHPQLDERQLALACVTSLLAILLHSLVDFNSYIPANAMVMAWVAGIAASIAPLPPVLPAYHAKKKTTVIDITT